MTRSITSSIITWLCDKSRDFATNHVRIEQTLSQVDTRCLHASEESRVWWELPTQLQHCWSASSHSYWGHHQGGGQVSLAMWDEDFFISRTDRSIWDSISIQPNPPPLALYRSSLEWNIAITMKPLDFPQRKALLDVQCDKSGIITFWQWISDTK